MSSSWSEFPFSFFAGSVHCSVSRVYYLKINRFLFCSFAFPFIHIIYFLRHEKWDGVFYLFLPI